MVSVIRSEWYRGIRSRRFWVTVALALVLFGITMVLYANPLVPQLTPRTNNIYTVTLAFLGNFFQALWPVLLPVIAVLPAGDSMAVDRRRGVDAALITRVGWTSYFGGKVVGNGLLSTFGAGRNFGKLCQMTWKTLGRCFHVCLYLTRLSRHDHAINCRVDGPD